MYEVRWNWYWTTDPDGSRRPVNSKKFDNLEDAFEWARLINGRVFAL